MPRYINAEQIPFIDSGEEKIAYKDVVDQIPTADVEEVRHGEWIPQPQMDDRYSKYYLCSVCKRLNQVSHSYDINAYAPYCHCGAKMDGETDDN